MEMFPPSTEAALLERLCALSQERHGGLLSHAVGTLMESLVEASSIAAGRSNDGQQSDDVGDDLFAVAAAKWAGCPLIDVFTMDRPPAMALAAYYRRLEQLAELEPAVLVGSVVLVLRALAGAPRGTQRSRDDEADEQHRRESALPLLRPAAAQRHHHHRHNNGAPCPANGRTLILTPCNAHRLALASVQLSMKALTGTCVALPRLAAVGGVTVDSLLTLERSLFCLLDYDAMIVASPVDDAESRCNDSQQRQRPNYYYFDETAENFATVAMKLIHVLDPPIAARQRAQRQTLIERTMFGSFSRRRRTSASIVGAMVVRGELQTTTSTSAAGSPQLPLRRRSPLLPSVATAAGDLRPPLIASGNNNKDQHDNTAKPAEKPERREKGGSLTTASAPPQCLPSSLGGSPSAEWGPPLPLPPAPFSMPPSNRGGDSMSPFNKGDTTTSLRSSTIPISISSQSSSSALSASWSFPTFAGEDTDRQETQRETTTKGAPEMARGAHSRNDAESGVSGAPQTTTAACGNRQSAAPPPLSAVVIPSRTQSEKHPNRIGDVPLPRLPVRDVCDGSDDRNAMSTGAASVLSADSIMGGGHSSKPIARQQRGLVASCEQRQPVGTQDSASPAMGEKHPRLGSARLVARAAAGGSSPHPHLDGAMAAGEARGCGSGVHNINPTEATARAAPLNSSSSPQGDRDFSAYRDVEGDGRGSLPLLSATTKTVLVSPKHFGRSVTPLVFVSSSS